MEEIQRGEKKKVTVEEGGAGEGSVEIDAAKSSPKLVAQYPWSANSKKQWRKWMV
jgi:hypothetical protein